MPAGVSHRSFPHLSSPSLEVSGSPQCPGQRQKDFPTPETLNLRKSTQHVWIWTNSSEGYKIIQRCLGQVLGEVMGTHMSNSLALGRRGPHHRGTHEKRQKKSLPKWRKGP